jgi:hypothetical protein
MVIPEGVTNIAWGAFTRCRSLANIDIPNSVVHIGEYAFQDCALTSVIIPDSVESIADGVFMDCNSLINITVGVNNPNYTAQDGNLYSKDGKKLLVYAPGKSATTFIIPEDVTSIGTFAFYGCPSLTTLVIPNNVVTVESDAIAWCESLTVYCEVLSLPDNWSADWIYSHTVSFYYGADWKYDENGNPIAKKAAYVGNYGLHHIERGPISGGQATTYNLGDYYFGTVLSEYTIQAYIREGTGNDCISYYFSDDNAVYVSCHFVILDDSLAVAYLDTAVDLFNNGNATDVFYFDIVDIDGQPCFVLRATLGQSNYAYYVVKSSI